MATVQSILAKKGSDIISVAPGETVLKAAQLMSERGIGGLVVTEGKRLAGIFTERDILRRVVAQRRDPTTTKVADVMTTPVTACGPDTPIDDCAAMMTAKRIRHLPVVGDTGLVGVITIGDVLAYQVSEQQATIDYMHHFMFDLR
ncbi:MAG TPA: CBS domain-containing protein [Gemmatimonadales bacterium]|nr:CBS domain-containing protein [Gemmatimonadales bacterium]